MKIKEFIKGFLKITTTVVVIIMLVSPIAVFAQDDDPDSDGFLNDKTIDVLKSFQDETGFRSFSNNNLDGASRSPGLDNITGLLVTIIGVIKYIVGGLAVLYVFITVVKAVGGGDESGDRLAKIKKHLGHILTAFIAIFAVDFFVNNVFVIAGNENFLSSEDAARRFATAGAGEIRGIYRVVQALIGSIAIVSLVQSAMRLVFNAGNEEVGTRAKKHIRYAATGLVLVGIAEFFIQGFVFKDAGTTIDINAGKMLIAQVTNFLSGFIATVALASLFYAGYLYVFSGVGTDNADKVKKIIIGAVIALLISAGAFALVNTVIQLDSSEAPAILEEQVDRLSTF